MYLGIDTSNYTTSVAVYDNSKVIQQKKLLAVKSGEKGLRQSDAVFQHTVNLPQLIQNIAFSNVEAIAVSNKPRNVEGSYMPCFLVGEGVAQAISSVNNIKLYKTSHQVGHILSALYSCNRLDLINEKFIAFHISGGTTEALIVTPDESNIINCNLVAQSSDLKAGQAIDRTGVMLGMNFPCGKELDLLLQKSDKQYKIKPSINGLNCSLSGVENKVKAMFDKGEPQEDIAKFALSYITASLDKMLELIMQEYGNMPVLFSGGVSSNSMIKKTISEKYGAYFADSEFACDNAVGIAIYAYLKSKKL